MWRQMQELVADEASAKAPDEIIPRRSLAQSARTNSSQLLGGLSYLSQETRLAGNRERLPRPVIGVGHG